MSADNNEQVEVNVRVSDLTEEVLADLRKRGLTITAVHKFLRVASGQISRDRITDLEHAMAVEFIEESREIESFDVVDKNSQGAQLAKYRPV